MVEAARTICPTRFALPLAAALAALAAAACPSASLAQGTHLWTQSRLEEFEKGTPEGVSLSSDGHLRIAPGLSEVLTTPSTFVWSVAAGKDGVAFIGTGSPATVQRVASDGKSTTLFETHDLTVQALKLGPDGALYAATMPSGKVYRLKTDAPSSQDESSAALVFDPSRLNGEKAPDNKPETKPGDDRTASKPETRSHYVWDLAFDSTGRLYIACGGPGAVYRVDPAKTSAAPEEFFKSDEQHIRTLAWDAHGNLIAGSDGSGLVYRINPQGKGYVLFEAPRREITSVAVSTDGAIYAATVGDKSHNPLPPLPVQGNGVVTFSVVQPGSLQAANSSTSAPEGTEIYELKENQAPRKLWSGKDEVVYALASRPDGLLALTGNRGRIFVIQEDGSYADIAHLEAQQGLALSIANPDDRTSRAFIGTGNTGKLYALGAQQKHEYASDVLDAGATARFGRVEVQPGSSNYEILTRSGNVEQPVRGWSDWEPLKGGSIASPTGRFLQWKAVLRPSGILGSVGVNYLPLNAAPVVDEIVVVPGARINGANQPNPQQQPINISFPSSNLPPTVSFDTAPPSIPAIKDKGAITARWAAHDDNGDDLTFSLYLRGDGEQVWRLLKDNITEKAYTFDADLLPDGGYQIKVVASDAPSHSPGEALTGAKESDRFEVDTTPPVISGLKAGQQDTPCAQLPCALEVEFTFDAEDAMSPVTRAEYSLDAGSWQYIDPVGQLSDSRREHYNVHIPATVLENKPGEHLLTVRAYDRHENVGLAKTVFTTGPANPAK
jgi:WD40 repeat protein